jgi:hypothetical protein
MKKNIEQNSNLSHPENLWKAILAVRNTGETNMFDHETVMQIMIRMGFTEEADWVLINWKEYISLLHSGRG